MTVADMLNRRDREGMVERLIACFSQQLNLGFHD